VENNSILSKESSELLLMRLKKIQEKDSYISEQAVKALSKELNISGIQIYEVITFYSFLSHKAKGKYVIRVCHSPSCYLKGSTNIFEELEKILGIKVGEITKDGKFSIEYTSCIGCCNESPAILINNIPHTKLTTEKLAKILKKCK
jgi:NADH:ubiquinone oxidoreductase subunit E